MNRTITMCRAGSISLVVLVTILIPLCSSRPQYKCKSAEEICVQHNLCVNITAKLRSGNFESCGTENYVLFVCCRNVIKAPTPPELAPVPPQPQPLFGNSRNAIAIALQNCKKYLEYKYEIFWKDPDIPGKPSIPIKKANCVITSTLVVNGAPAEPKEYPHMALIGYGRTFQDVQWACGGSLISEKFILSAAHCGKTSIQGPPKWVKLGDLNISSTADDANPAVYAIAKVHDHPLYNAKLVTNDISLFELNTTVAMSPYVRPACLTTSTSYQLGTKGSITGWGLTGTAEKGSDHLLKATISTIKDSRCETRFRADGYNSSTMICAGDLKDGKDTCRGDSGGPLQTIGSRPCMWNIFGVTSYGAGICGNKEDPSVFTNVAFYLDWIQSIVWP